MVVAPHRITPQIRENITEQLRQKVEGQCTLEYGATILITKIFNLDNNGIIDVDKGSVHFHIKYETLICRPVNGEIVLGVISEVASTYVVVQCGPIVGVVATNNLPGQYHFVDPNKFICDTQEPDIVVNSQVWLRIINTDSLKDNTWVVAELVKVLQ